MKKACILLLVVIASFHVKAQSYIGFLTDNYSGVNSVVSNPANIADSRFKADINLVGAGVFGVNDYYGVNIMDALKDDYDFNLDAKKTPTTNNNVMFDADIMGPSFMFNINKKSAVAIFTRARSFGNIYDANGEIYESIEDDTSEDFNYDEGNIRVLGNAWAELGVTYSRILLNNKEQFLKGGLTVKYLQGAGSAYASGKSLSVNYDADGIDLGGGETTGSIASTGEVTYARFAAFEEDDYDYELLDNATGFGVDLGFIYEWRPNHADYNATNNNGDKYTYRDKNKYKLKLGLSITDIGSINYKDGIQDTYDVTNAGVSEEDLENAEDLDEILNTFYRLIGSKIGYKTQLPTALHINADWSFTQRLYVNLNTDLSLVSRDKVTASRISNMVSLTPRFESKWFSFYLPMSMVELSGFQAGAGLRAGPLYIGSGSVITALISNNSMGADVYAGLKIPVYQGRAKDRDDDGTIDKLDGCPKEAGPLENNGCPWGDADADGILDNVDKCPEEAGPEENKGCPWGDADADTVLDHVDACPEVAGPVENNGCPWKDTDGDGVYDKDDLCPEVAGPVENNGCPDTDGDGVLDKDDLCPTVVGLVENNGCPMVSEAVRKSLNAYAKTILFNTGKSTIKSQSKAVLDNIVGILNEYPNAKFAIEGHTDSSGSELLNQRLSESRASTVMTYLIENGVASSRLSAKGYGESRPIADNRTAAGRERNRRVEINLVK